MSAWHQDTVSDTSDPWWGQTTTYRDGHRDNATGYSLRLGLDPWSGETAGSAGELELPHWGFDVGRFADADGRTQVGLNVGAALGGKGSWASKADPTRGPQYVDYKTEDPYFTAVDLLTLGLAGNGKRVGNQIRGGEERATYTDMATSWMTGVHGTSGTRGGAKFFGEMSPHEGTMAALFNDGMRSEMRQEILSAHGQQDSLFAGQY